MIILNREFDVDPDKIEFLNPEMKKLLLKKQKQMSSKQLRWNENHENKFANHKTEMRIRLADLASTNSWNQVVLGSFIKLFIKRPNEAK